MLEQLLVLAADVTGEAAEAPAARPARPGGLESLAPLLPFVLILVVFFWLQARSQRKRQQQRQDMLDSIRPKDDVVTVGGIRGRVVKVSDDEVVVRVDPEKDIKITLAKTGIHGRVGEEAEE